MENFDKEKAEKAIDCIFDMIPWDQTPQGFNYWRGVTSNIAQLIEENEGEKE